jgi:O-antigen ligase
MMQKFLSHCKELQDYSRLRQFFCIFFAVFLMSQFIIPSNFAYSWIFYLCVGLPCLALYVSHPPMRTILCKNSLFVIFAMLCGYSILHDWIFDIVAFAMATTRHTSATFVFMISAVLWFSTHHSFLIRCYKLFLWVIIGCALVSMIIHISTYGVSERLSAIGQNDHPILGANIYSLYTLFGFYFLHHSQDFPRLYKRILPYAAISITAVLVLLTQSRGPFIALGMCCFVGLVATRHYKTVAIGCAAISLLMLDFVLYSQNAQHYMPLERIYESALHLLNRESHRMNIWVLTVELISKKPWVGYNLQTMFPYAYGGVNPHNIFLGAWYYTGIIGFILFMSIVVGSIVLVLRSRKSAEGFLGVLLLLYALLSCMTDQGQYVDSPSPLWSIFWLPIAYAIALQVRHPLRSYDVKASTHGV